jgi:hypothetical protein
MKRLELFTWGIELWLEPLSGNCEVKRLLKKLITTCAVSCGVAIWFPC